MSLRDKINAAKRFEAPKPIAVGRNSDAFFTPRDVADRMVEYLDLEKAMSVLEPSAGMGALVRAVRHADPSGHLRAVEREGAFLEHLDPWCLASCADFLDLTAHTFGTFDRVVMNPPFSHGADIRHVRHALSFLKPGGVLVALVADGPRQAKAFEEFEDLERLPDGTFTRTQVRTRIVRRAV